MGSRPLGMACAPMGAGSAPRAGGWRGAGGRTFGAPQEATGELAAVQSPGKGPLEKRLSKFGRDGGAEGKGI